MPSYSTPAACGAVGLGRYCVTNSTSAATRLWKKCGCSTGSLAAHAMAFGASVNAPSTAFVAVL